jgi:hypothetical protein
MPCTHIRPAEALRSNLRRVRGIGFRAGATKPGNEVTRQCRIIRVSDCAAVVAVVQKPRTIVPRFGKPVTIQPAPKLERISPQSEIPILNR